MIASRRSSIVDWKLWVSSVHPSTDSSHEEGYCLICGRTATRFIDPPRRTLARNSDPVDPNYAVIAVLPDLALCGTHYIDNLSGSLDIGWCDNARCRAFGEVGEFSPCGEPFIDLVKTSTKKRERK